ncbi:hypothetical protein D0A34_11960 [Microcoleus vaginatus PCC 9802]|nr:hypothetical protein MicvaDRAFT_4555 [Microcoleus vaginatus FGP-2]UNU19489.1 hypothetical protein D0A34_11960 [Microcoleus vaginatus PCC 9802]
MKHKKLVVVGAVPTVRALRGFRGLLEQDGACCNYCQACFIIFMANTTVRSPFLRMCDRTPQQQSGKFPIASRFLAK